MGIDVSLEYRPCKTCNHTPEAAFEGGYTYNVSKMWYLIYPDAPGIVHVDDLTGRSAIPTLEYAIDVMCKRKNEMLQLQPGNRWGTYEGFLQFLREMLAASQDNPDLIWRISR